MLYRFTKEIHTLDGKVFVFHFSRIYSANGILYYISVKTGATASHYFRMQEIRDGWYFSDISLLPEWIIPLERKLERAIEENE